MIELRFPIFYIHSPIFNKFYVLPNLSAIFS